MQKPFLTPEVLAIRWKITPKTLSQWRWNGHGPKYCKIGKLVRYSLDDIEAFELSNRNIPGSTSGNLQPSVFTANSNLPLKGTNDEE